LDVWNELNGTMLSADQAMLDAKQAVEGVGEAFKEGGKSIAGNSVAALENRISLELAGKAAADAAQKYRDNGGSAAGAAKIMEDLRVAAVKETGATGAQRAAIAALSLELFRLPANTNATVNLRVLGMGTLNSAQNILRQMDRVTGVASGGILSYAVGGVENHVAQIVKAGAMRLWGEPETGGEAYIPLAAQKRTRSLSILAEVAKRFGYNLTAAGLPVGGGFTPAGGGGGGGSGLTRLHPADLAELARIVMSRPLQLFLDSRQIDYALGALSTAYSRSR
jgi:hypothetical protein